MLNIIGHILWCLMFITPLFTIPFTWKIFENKIYNIILGLVLAGFVSVLLFFICIAIAFHDFRMD
jgi:hypothetical protein